MANMKNQFWSPLFDKAVPPFHCPFHAVSKGLSAKGGAFSALKTSCFQGRYVGHNCTVDMNMLKNLPIPLEKYYWRVQADVYDPVYFSCVHFAARIQRTFTAKT